MLTTDNLSSIRAIALGLTGMICLAYAVLSLLYMRPDPMPFWIPGLAGVAAWLAIMFGTIGAGTKNTERAFDEGYRSDNHRAERAAYWVALLLYPIFAVPLIQGWVSFDVAFAAMGTLTGAAYLLPVAWLDYRGRV